MHNLNFTLEQLNAVSSILSFALLLVLTYFLWDWLDYRQKKSWHGMLVGIPPAIGMAFVLYLENLGTLTSRMVIWFWRTFAWGQVPFTDIQMALLILGATLTSLGMLLMIRLLTLYKLGNWPWLTSALVAGAYVLVSSGFHML